MLILALEFSSPERSVALFDSAPNGRGLIGMLSDQRPRGGGPLPLVDKLLQGAKVGPETIQGVAVGLGPGSYTGIRSAIAIAQGWRLARGVRLAGISSAECLAWQALEEGWTGEVRILVNAQRGEAYLARYRTTDKRPEPVEPLRLLKVDELRSELAQPAPLWIGPEIERWFPDGRTLYPAASTVARLAAAQLQSGGTEHLEPIYLRETAFVKAPKARRLPI